MNPSLLALARRAMRNLPRKIAAVAIATLVWYFAAGDTSSVSQRSLLIPITVEGLAADGVVVGLPEFAEVTLIGPTGRLDRLRPESVEAVLDLSGATGNFQLPVLVSPPQGITLDRVVPNEVIGQLERVARRELPVVVSVLGPWPEGTRGEIVASPDVALVTGRASVLNEAVLVSVTLDAANLSVDGNASAAGTAIDARGRPRLELAVEPVSFALTWRVYGSLREKRVALVIATPSDARWRIQEPLPTSLIVLGDGPAWEALNEVRANVEWPTTTPSAGRYTAGLRLALPEGVMAAQTPTITVEYTPTPAQD